MDVCEIFVKDVTKVLWEGRRAGAKKFYSAYLNVELGLLSTGDDDVEDVNEMCGPLCWQGCENDQGDFKKLMWYEVKKEFNCKATSTRFCCDDEREMSYSHRNWGKDGNGRTSQLDYILGPRMASDQVYVHNDVKLWSTWDLYLINATIQEDDDQGYFAQKKKRKRRDGQDGGWSMAKQNLITQKP